MKTVAGHTARKRFGQNFLVSPGIIHKIVDAIAPHAGDTVVEIGPGLGAITEPLLERIDHLQVVEIDRDLIARLQQRFAPERLTVHEGDALKFDFGSLKDSGPLKIVGNLPYNISSPLLFHLAAFADRVCDQHFMLQKEVVDRMVAAPGSKAFSRLSVMLQVRYYMELVLEVPPGSFNPPPKVDSAVVRMIPWPADKSPYAPVDMRALGTVVTMAFSQRRKVLRNTLGALRDVIDFEALGFDLGRRAEEVPVAEFVTVANALPADRIAGSLSDGPDLSED